MGTSTHQQVYKHSQDTQQFANIRCDGWSGSLLALLEPLLLGASLAELLSGGAPGAPGVLLGPIPPPPPPPFCSCRLCSKQFSESGLPALEPVS